MRDVEAMREHYARTARHWIETFDKHYDQFVALQGDQAAGCGGCIWWAARWRSSRAAWASTRFWRSSPPPTVRPRCRGPALGDAAS
ncbi:mycolic acid cyclopropane synthetase family protein [Mycobacterium xenopi 4042]|uniref:Mycolic acid cyclopropane synthetase family protein n=1 Tax=Mycobacterium xenopi 4042 TaxID=1299334 RepID=X8DKE9_MYCXE|nr:mycolic acid cyclopropane synthetase family protein [Mycobacterium xenopi 4042]